MAEQAAQLALKGLSHGVGAGATARGHDLVVLLNETSARAGLELTEDLRTAAVRLGRHYQPARYPDALEGGTPHTRYTDADTDEALEDAGTLMAAADATHAALVEAATSDEP